MRGATARKIDWFEFWIRFACGALLGLLIGIRLVLYWYDESPAILVLVGVSVISFVASLRRDTGTNFGTQFSYASGFG